MKIVSFLLLIVFLSGCNAVKRVPDGQYLLGKNTVYVNATKTEDAKIDNFIIQKPNAALLGLPLGLYIYNAAKPNPEEDFQDWLDRNSKWNSTLERILSQKQVQRLKQSFLVSGLHNQLKNIGEAPVILNPAKTKSSVNYLKSYYNSIGYFNASVSDSTFYNPDTDKKRANVSYYIQTGERYYLDTLHTSIASSQIDSVYRKHLNKSFLKSGKPYQLSDFGSERSRLASLFRNNGFYTFQPSSINFEIKRDTLETNNDQKLEVTTIIDDLIERDGDEITKKVYKIHKMNNIRIFADYDYTKGNTDLDSIQYKDLTIFYRGKLKYKPRILKMASALEKGAIYSDENRGLTYKQINNLRIFRYPNIEFKYAENDSLQTQLDANIYLVPMDKFSLRLTNELKRSEIERFGITLGTSFSTRNIFRQSEILEVNMQGTFASQTNSDDPQFFNMSEISGDVRLIFPEILFLFNTKKLIPYSMTPQTIVQVGTSYQKNIGLDKQNVTGVLRYAWSPKKNRAVLDLFNVQYVHNLNPQNFFNVYRATYNRLNDIAKNYPLDPQWVDAGGDLTTTQGGAIHFMRSVLVDNQPALSDADVRSVLSIAERHNRLVQDDFILSTSYTFVLNNNSQFFERDFSQFRVKVESAGNLLGLLSKTYRSLRNQPNTGEFLGVKYAQFIKTEFDYIKHFPLGRDASLAFRSFFGIAIPYGNSTNVPFSQSYFAGGSSDNRGWKAYSLGPGGSGSFLDYNEANMKLTLNLEYRFPIAGAFKGALFTDAGNIWNVLDDSPFDTAKFTNFSSLKDIGVSSGVGLRYDFGFFVIRLDVANRIYNPANEIGRRWFTDIAMRNTVFNIGINYPF
ncbi:BamA/TamA family outer membrane protein [Capnocytophaga sp.]|uniref:translocation and assembly module lipoprotein TamL n=1 Tax=Capnocytophaga sp. TaxID=44737 RepID=UPI0026DBF653|nr:BamA/TamA family outer membrane protein [Capnocytophaga sp.]MDO5106204.1 BamA/TamA family outer membrane protein [Capnocytophaga sp.]